MNNELEMVWLDYYAMCIFPNFFLMFSFLNEQANTVLEEAVWYTPRAIHLIQDLHVESKLSLSVAFVRPTLETRKFASSSSFDLARKWKTGVKRNGG
jgi:hypothetical protein